MGTVVCIHQRLRAMYDKTCQQARDEAIVLFATATLAQLRQAREEVARPPGTLSVRQRAWMRGQLSVIDELTEQAMLAQAQQPTRSISWQTR